jgi:hypothetical protein
LSHHRTFTAISGQEQESTQGSSSVPLRFCCYFRKNCKKYILYARLIFLHVLRNPEIVFVPQCFAPGDSYGMVFQFWITIPVHSVVADEATTEADKVANMAHLAADEAATKADEAADETTKKVEASDESSTKANETSTKADEPATKADEAADKTGSHALLAAEEASTKAASEEEAFSKAAVADKAAVASYIKSAAASSSIKACVDLTDDAAAFRSTKDGVDLTDDVIASRPTKACVDLTDYLAMGCEDVDYVDDDDLSEVTVTSSVVGMYHNKEEASDSWAASLSVCKGYHLLIVLTMTYFGVEAQEVINPHNVILSSPLKAQCSRSAAIEHQAAAMTVIAQVRAQLFCYSRVDEVICIRGGGSVFNLYMYYGHLSNAEISELLSLDADLEDGADMEKPDARNMAHEVQCMLYMVKAYQYRALELFVQKNQLASKEP